MSEPATKRLVTAVFHAWRQAKIEFLVLRNYQQLPEVTENDIDVLVRPAQRVAAEQILLSAAQQAGFRLHNRAQFATLALYLFEPTSGAQVHFDLFSQLLWRGFDFLEGEPLLERKIDRGLFYIPHPAHEAATNLLASMIYTGSVKEKYKDSIAAGFSQDPRMALELLRPAYGQTLAAFLVEAGQARQWPAIESRVGALRRQLILRQCAFRPWRTAAQLGSMAARVARRLAFPPGCLIALCGPDGSGKSTAAQLLSAQLKTTFSPQKSAYFHWKPRLWPRARENSASHNPHGRPPRPAPLSWFYFALHWFEFVLASLFRIRPLTFRGGLVVIDRYYYDFFVDLSRYRMRVPPFLVRLGYHFIQKADLVIVLDAPAELLQRRKSEVPLSETERQRHAYRRLVEAPVCAQVVDASRPPEEVARQIQNTLLQWLAQRAEARHDDLSRTAHVPSPLPPKNMDPVRKP